MLRLIGKVLTLRALLDMTLIGSVIILFVLITRLCLKRSPKVYSYVLWLVVLYRLLCPVWLFVAPVSVFSPARPSVIVSEDTIGVSVHLGNERVVSRDVLHWEPNSTVKTIESKALPQQISLSMVVTEVWTVGFSLMVLHGIWGFLRLRKKLIGTVKIRKGVFLTDGIDTPFVLGVLRPKIYLPSGIPIAQRPLILAHEQHHIRRLDMLWKLLGYLALCLHWFNPLVWLAFVLAGKDMEMSCDEAVLRKMDKTYHADYAAALLRLSTGRRTIAGTPLAFGEGDVKSRIRNMASWKKPKVWISVLCGCICIGVVVFGALDSQSYYTKHEIMGPNTVRVSKLSFTIDWGYSYIYEGDRRKESTEGVLYHGTTPIGGVRVFPMESVPTDGLSWISQLDFPEWKMDNIGYYAGGEGGDNYSIEFFSDVPPGVAQTVLNKHYLYYADSRIYDLWFDGILVDNNTQQIILDSVSLESETANTVSESSATEAANQGAEILFLQNAECILLDCTQMQAELMDASLTAGVQQLGEPEEPGIVSGSMDIQDYLQRQYQGFLTEDCLGQILANRSFYRSAALSKEHSADIFAENLTFTRHDGSQPVYSYSADLVADDQTVAHASGVITLEANGDSWLVSNLSMTLKSS